MATKTDKEVPPVCSIEVRRSSNFGAKHHIQIGVAKMTRSKNCSTPLQVAAYYESVERKYGYHRHAETRHAIDELHETRRFS